MRCGENSKRRNSDGGAQQGSWQQRRTIYKGTKTAKQMELIEICLADGWISAVCDVYSATRANTSEEALSRRSKRNAK